jgi:Mu-like prophage I protein
MKDAAGAWMKKLDAQPDGLYADDVSYTSIGNKSLNEGIYKLFSPSFYLKDYTDPETGEKYNNVLTGGAFCNKPVLGHSLPPLVYSETANEKTLLTEDKNSSTVFIDITKNLHMDLHEIAKTPKDKRTSDQQKFLTEHQDELTFAEAKAEGLVPAKEEAKGETKLSEGQVAVDAKEWSETKEAAKAGKEAAQQLAEEKMTKELTGLIENDEGIAVKKDQIPGMVKLAMNMSEDDRKAYFEILKGLPKQKIFAEQGKDNAVNMSENPQLALSQLANAKIAEAKKDGKELAYSEAENQVMREHPELVDMAFPRGV